LLFAPLARQPLPASLVHVQRQPEHDAFDALARDHLEHLRRRHPGRGDFEHVVRRREPPARVTQRQADAAGSEINRQCSHGDPANPNDETRNPNK
jgi:hypothetical protein